MRRSVGPCLILRPSKENGIFSIAECSYGRTQIRRFKEGVESFRASAVRPKMVKLIVPFVIQSNHQQAAIGQNLGPHRVIQNQPLIAAEPRNRIDAPGNRKHTIVVNSAAVIGPVQFGNVSARTILGEHGPVTRFGVHHCYLCQAVCHGLESQRMTVGRNTRAHRNARPSQHLGGPVGSGSASPRSRPPPRCNPKKKHHADCHSPGQYTSGRPLLLCRCGFGHDGLKARSYTRNRFFNGNPGVADVAQASLGVFYQTAADESLN